jgi:hypothetical protein
MTWGAAIRRLVFVAGVVCLAGCTGKGSEGTCGDATAMCGSTPGDPTGTWTVNGTCVYQADMPNRPMSLTELTTRPLNPSIAPPQPQPTTDGSWCSDLVVTPASSTAPSQVSSVNLWHDLPTLKVGQVAFNSNSTYSVDLTFAEEGASTHFTPYCLQYQGKVAIDCGGLATEMQAFYKQAAGMHPVAFQNITCQSATDEGCDCSYDYSVEVTDAGTWVKSDNLIQESSTQYLYNGQPVMSQAPELSMLATYCQDSNSLTLSGYEGSNLSELVGLRTLSLSRM